jgi:endonuclease/exonuclease/phosphatase (EEP) superfamily protein YafD
MVKRIKGPVVVAGDFNMTPFSTRFGTLLQEARLRRAKGGLNTTWPTQLTPMGFSLDHILVGKGIGSAVMRTGSRLGSDHLPVVGTFDLGK